VSATQDPLVLELRAEISELDRGLLTAINRRLQIVRRLHEHKRVTGLPLRDPEREDAMLRLLEAENTGPLSSEGVARLHRFVLELTMEEVHGA